MPELASGDTVAGYRLDTLAGVGGMGRVYRAFAPGGDVVAIKLLRGRYARDPNMIARFRREGAALRRLDHPHGVRALDHGDDFIAMPFVDGVPLATLLDADGAWPLARATRALAQLLAALAHVHARGLVHADIKADNLLVGANDHVTLIDFGVARWLDAPVPTRAPSGTPEYMAPEVIRGEPATPAADVYAAGVLLYELVTGATPFAGGTAGEVLARHLGDVVVPPALRHPELEVPRAFEHAMMRALAKSPAERFGSATELADALARAAPAVDTPIPPPAHAHADTPTRNCRPRA